MTFILATRNPHNGKLLIVAEADDSYPDLPAEFETEEKAIEAAANTTICKAWGYQIVEVGK